MFRVTIQGLPTIEKDYKSQESKIRLAIPMALELVGTEMQNDLRRSIFEDVYQKYTPKGYERRTEGSGFEPLESYDYMAYSVRGASLDFGYFPSGEHSDERWYQRDGDDLIKWLQSPHQNIPARPFWDYFVEKQEIGALITFADGMKPYDVQIDSTERIDLSEFKISGASLIDELLDSEV